MVSGVPLKPEGISLLLSGENIPQVILSDFLQAGKQAMAKNPEE